MAETRTVADETGRIGHRRTTEHPMIGVGARAALVVVASAATVLWDAPTWLRTVLTLAAALVVTEWVVRSRRRGLLDAALVGAAGLVVAAVLLGLVLNLTPDGLTRQSWAVGAGIIGLAALAAGLRGPTSIGLLAQARADWALSDQVWSDRDAAPDRPARRTPPRHGPSIVVGVVCSVLAIAVVGVSFVVAAASTRQNQIAPLEMSMIQTDGRVTGVTLSSGSADGPYDLIVLADGTATTAAAAMYLDGTPRTVPVTVPTVGRALINLVPVGATTPVRQLIVDDGRLTPSEVAPTTLENQVVPLEMVTAETNGRITGVSLRSNAVVGPYDLKVLTDGGSTTAAAAFYLDSTPRTVPITVPSVGRVLVNLVPVGAETPALQLIIEDGRLTP